MKLNINLVCSLINLCCACLVISITGLLEREFSTVDILIIAMNMFSSGFNLALSMEKLE